MTDEKKENLPVPVDIESGRGLQPRNIEELYRLATAAARSGLAPSSFKTPEQCLVAMQKGMEAGLTPMAALQSIVVVNGKASWTGAAALALVRASGLGIIAQPTYSGEGDDLACTVTGKRTDTGEELSSTFSVDDAKRARLWGKQGPWSQYPRRMLYWRALGFLLNDLFGDVLTGMKIAEEVRDYPAERDVTPQPSVKAEEDPLLADIAGGVAVSTPQGSTAGGEIPAESPQESAPPSTEPEVLEPEDEPESVQAQKDLGWGE